MSGLNQLYSHTSLNFPCINQSSDSKASKPRRSDTTKGRNCTYRQPDPPLPSPNHQPHSFTPTASYSSPHSSTHKSNPPIDTTFARHLPRFPSRYPECTISPLSAPVYDQSNRNAAFPHFPLIHEKTYWLNDQKGECSCWSCSWISYSSEQYPQHTEAPPAVQTYGSHLRAPVPCVQGTSKNLNQT